MAFKFRPQFTIYHPEMDALLLWSNASSQTKPDETFVFIWGTELYTDFRYLLVTMHHFRDIETDPSRLNFLIYGMLNFLKDTGVWEEVMLIPIDRDTGTDGKDKTIIADLDFVRAMRAA